MVLEPPIKLLARLSPAATTESILYAAEQSGMARIQGFTVVNRSPSPGSFRFSISPKGSPTTNQDYQYYDLPIDGNNTFMATLDVNLEAFDVVRVYSLTENLTFCLFGYRR